MNFKEIYKNANNGIYADKAKIDAIFAKAEKRKSFISLYYKQISACAAAVLLIFAVSIISLYNNGNNSKNNIVKKTNANGETTLQIADNAPGSHSEPINSDSVDVNVTDDNSSGLEDAPEAQDKNDKVDPDYTEDIKVDKADDASQNVPASIEEPQEKSVIESSTIVPRVNVPVVTSQEKSSSESRSSGCAGGSGGGSGAGGGGGGGSSSASGGGVYTKSVGMSVKEYYAYLGINISSAFSDLPAGMKLSIPDMIYVQKDSTGRIVDDVANFTFLDYNNPEKIIVVSTTKFSGKKKRVSGDAELSKITINNSPVVLIVSDNNVNANFKVNDVLFDVNSAGISVDEIKAFIASCIK